MANMFQIEASDLINLRKFYKKAPKKFSRAAAGVLSAFAFGTRKEAINTIQSKMTVRNKKFVEGSFSVIKASTTKPIDKKVSIVGSVRRPRFSGWEEQQKGKKRPSTRVATLLARSNSKKKQIANRARMKPGKDFQTPDDFPGKNKQQKTAVMLSMIRRTKGRRKPFIIGKHHRKFTPGLYKFQRNKLQLLQQFDSKKAQPRRFDWMGMSRKRFFKNASIRNIWADQLKRVLK